MRIVTMMMMMMLLHEVLKGNQNVGAQTQDHQSAQLSSWRWCWLPLMARSGGCHFKGFIYHRFEIFYIFYILYIYIYIIYYDADSLSWLEVEGCHFKGFIPLVPASDAQTPASFLSKYYRGIGKFSVTRYFTGLYFFLEQPDDIVQMFYSNRWAHLTSRLVHK